MLVLSRKCGESIVIGNGITVTVVDVRGDRVRLGFNAPAEVPIHRKEVQQRIDAAAPALRNAEYGRDTVERSTSQPPAFSGNSCARPTATSRPGSARGSLAGRCPRSALNCLSET
jgi:carbon storage regulator